MRSWKDGDGDVLSDSTGGSNTVALMRTPRDSIFVNRTGDARQYGRDVLIPMHMREKMQYLFKSLDGRASRRCRARTPRGEVKRVYIRHLIEPPISRKWLNY